MVELRLHEDGGHSLVFRLLRDFGYLLRGGPAVAHFDRFLDESVVGCKVGEGPVVDVEGAALFRGERLFELGVEFIEIGLEGGEVRVDLRSGFGGEVVEVRSGGASLIKGRSAD